METTKKQESSEVKLNVPFFARKLTGQAIVVKTGIKAGAAEEASKRK